MDLKLRVKILLHVYVVCRWKLKKMNIEGVFKAVSRVQHMQTQVQVQVQCMCEH